MTLAVHFWLCASWEPAAHDVVGRRHQLCLSSSFRSLQLFIVIADMCSRQVVSQVQSLLLSPPQASSSPSKRQKELFSLQEPQQEIRCLIQKAIDASSVSTKVLVEDAVNSLAESSEAVQRQLDQLERSTVLSLTLDELNSTSISLEQLMKTRHCMISDLHAKLMACQSDLGTHLSSILQESSTKLRAIATDGMAFYSAPYVAAAYHAHAAQHIENTA